MKKITWLDGNDSAGMFILEISFDNGGLGYIKKPTFAQSNDDLNYFWGIHPGIVGMKIYDPAGNVVADKNNKNTAVAC